MDAGQVSKGGHVAGLCSNGEGMDPQRWRAAEDLVVLGDVTISGAGQSIRKQHVNTSACSTMLSRHVGCTPRPRGTTASKRIHRTSMGGIGKGIDMAAQTSRCLCVECEADALGSTRTKGKAGV